MLEKIAFGYKLALKDFDSIKKTGEAYVGDHKEEFGGEENLKHPLIQFGGIFAWITHSKMGYNSLSKKDVQYRLKKIKTKFKKYF